MLSRRAASLIRYDYSLLVEPVIPSPWIMRGEGPTGQKRERRDDIRNCLKRGEVGADEVTGRMKRQAYPSALTDAEWQRITPLLPRRWAVERTCAWLSQNRRLSKDYERLCTSESMISGALTRLMPRRLAQS